MKSGIDFTSGKILSKLLLFAGPVLLALLLQSMYGAVDLLIAGKFASSADVSAVSTGSQIMMTITGLISSLCMNKSFRLPARFAMMETANDPRSIFSVPGIEERAEQFAKRILCG